LLAELALRLSAQARHRLSESQTRLAALQLRLARRRPSQDALESALRKAVHRMRENMANCLNRTSRRLDIAQARLAGLDPHLVLARGYTFVTDPLGTPVLSAAAAAPGQTLRLHWADGGRQVTVDGQDPVPSVGKMQAVKDD
jgi:exodeoxyribonuclease VII large subunit